MFEPMDYLSWRETVRQSCGRRVIHRGCDMCYSSDQPGGYIRGYCAFDSCPKKGGLV